MRNQAVVLTVGVSLLVFGVIVWFITAIYLPGERTKIQNEFNMKYSPMTVFMVNSDDGIYSNTIITQDLFDQKSIIPVDVPAIFLPQDKNGGLLVYTANDQGAMLKKRTTKKLNKGEFIIKKTFESTEPLTDEEKRARDDEEFRRKSEYTLKNNVGGDVKTGSLVDIILDYGNGDYDIVISKIKIDRIIGGTDPAAAQAAAGPVDTKVILSLDEVQYRDMELAKKVGTLKVRLYNDEEQIPSLQTFKYDETKSLILATIRAKTLLGDIANYGTSTFVGFLGDKSDIVQKLNDRLNYYKEQREILKLQQEMQAAQAAKKASDAAKAATPTK